MLFRTNAMDQCPSEIGPAIVSRSKTQLSRVLGLMQQVRRRASFQN